jgi:hypothetical protein
MTQLSRTGFAVRLWAALAVGIGLLFTGNGQIVAGTRCAVILHKTELRAVTGMNADGSKFGGLD